jgi:hypothetical protein
VNNGPATLSGGAVRDSEKWDAVRATKRVTGVGGTANQINWFSSVPKVAVKVAEAETFVRPSEAPQAGSPAGSPPVHQQTEQEAVEAWENEGDPN